MKSDLDEDERKDFLFQIQNIVLLLEKTPTLHHIFYIEFKMFVRMKRFPFHYLLMGSVR